MKYAKYYVNARTDWSFDDPTALRACTIRWRIIRCMDFARFAFLVFNTAHIFVRRCKLYGWPLESSHPFANLIKKQRSGLVSLCNLSWMWNRERKEGVWIPNENHIAAHIHYRDYCHCCCWSASSYSHHRQQPSIHFRSDQFISELISVPQSSTSQQGFHLLWTIFKAKECRHTTYVILQITESLSINKIFEGKYDENRKALFDYQLERSSNRFIRAHSRTQKRVKIFCVVFFHYGIDYRFVAFLPTTKLTLAHVTADSAFVFIIHDQSNDTTGKWKYFKVIFNADNDCSLHLPNVFRKVF